VSSEIEQRKKPVLGNHQVKKARQEDQQSEEGSWDLPSGGKEIGEMNPEAFHGNIGR